jgi:hypothetical protein
MVRDTDEKASQNNKTSNQPGPGAYHCKSCFPWTLEEDRGKFRVKEATPGPTFGSRFNSSIRSKEHMCPRKAEGPGPGDYKLPGAIKIHRRANSST